MNRPSITALIDTYNQGRYVEEAIESVLRQEFPVGEMEVVVVDDGSADDTAERVARLGNRVRYIRKENGGQASALNAGFAEARGEIIALLDGDDQWLPGKVARVAEAFEKNPDAGMVYHPFVIWNAERNESREDTEFRALSGKVSERVEDLLRFGGPSTSGISVRRKALDRILPIPAGLKILADGYLGYVIVFVAPVVALKEPLTRYRVHGENRFTFAARDPERMRQRWSCLALAGREVEAWLGRNGFDVKEPAIASYLRRARLTAENLRIRAEGAGRRELYGHLREEIEVYGPIWSRRYRALRRAQAMLALLFGARAYRAAERAYREATPLVKLREAMFPAGRS